MARPYGPQLFSRSGDGAAGAQRCAGGRDSSKLLSSGFPLHVVVAVALAFTSSQGCTTAALAIPALLSAAGTAAKEGVSYAREGRANKTFAAPADPVRQNILAALEDMAFVVESYDKGDSGERIVARGESREVEVTLEAITPKATKVRVIVNEGTFWKDRATAEEIIEQAGRGVDVVVTAARAARGRAVTPTVRRAPPGEELLPASSAATLDREPWDPQRWRDGFRASPVPPGVKTQIVGEPSFVAPLSHSLISLDTLSPEDRFRRCQQDYVPFPWPLRRGGRELVSCGRDDVRGAPPVP